MSKVSEGVRGIPVLLSLQAAPAPCPSPRFFQLWGWQFPELLSCLITGLPGSQMSWVRGTEELNAAGSVRLGPLSRRQCTNQKQVKYAKTRPTRAAKASPEMPRESPSPNPTSLDGKLTPSQVSLAQFRGEQEVLGPSLT